MTDTISKKRIAMHNPLDLFFSAQDVVKQNKWMTFLEPSTCFAGDFY